MTLFQAMPSETEMWRACVDRDGSFDGLFVLAVRTTGIFCRAACPARKPNRENVEFFPSAKAALTAGYRPCKRCRPMEVGQHRPAWVQELIDEIERMPDGRRLRDRDLRERGVDPARARRWFQANHGMTFQAYQRSLRLGTALAGIRNGDDLNAAGLGSGFDSASGFRDAFERLFGRTPGRSRDAACLTVAWMDTPVGPFIAGATSEGLGLFEFADRRALEKQITTVVRRLDRPAVPGTNAILEQTKAEIAEYFNGTRRDFTMPLYAPGSEFQESVWRGLREIPYGETWSYEQLAKSIGRPGASRAVGRANGENRIAVIIPCHRVIGADGTLTGYGGGLWRKRFLLELETGNRGSDPA